MKEMSNPWAGLKEMSNPWEAAIVPVAREIDTSLA